MGQSVEEYLIEKIDSEGTIHITLIDPEKVTPSQASRMARKAKSSGTSVNLVCKHTVNVHLGLRRSDLKRFTYLAAATAYDCTVFITDDFNPNCFLSAYRA